MVLNLQPRVLMCCVLVALLTLSCHTVAARKLNVPKGSHTSSVEIVKSPNYRPKQVPTTELYASIFLKHKQAMPPALKKAWGRLKAGRSSQRRDTLTSSVATWGFYTIPVGFGTPEQTSYLMLDTGSWNLWAYSWLMAETENSDTYLPYDLTGRHYYNATKSSTAEPMDGESYTACYGSGCVWADTMWWDTVYISTLAITENPVPAINYEEIEWWPYTTIDGIFGLGIASEDGTWPDPQIPIMPYLLPQLISPIFTVKLIQGGGGSLDLGIIDSSKFIGSIAYSPVTILPGTSGGFWAFNSTGFQIGNSTWHAKSIQFMTDTGAPYSTLPPSVISAFWAQVTGAVQATDGSWSYPCANSVPDLYIGVGIERVKIYSEHLIGGVTSTPGWCFGSVQTGGENDFQTFGWQLMTSVFMVHDFGEMRMGFANRSISS